MSKELAKKVHEIAKLNGIKKKDIAKQLGITQSMLASKINGDTRTSMLQDIANILGVQVSDLIEDKADVIVCPNCMSRYELKK